MGVPAPLGKGTLWLAGQPVEVGQYRSNQAFQPDIAAAGRRVEQAEEVARLVGGLRPALGRMREHAALQLLLAAAECSPAFALDPFMALAADWTDLTMFT